MTEVVQGEADPLQRPRTLLGHPETGLAAVGGCGENCPHDHGDGPRRPHEEPGPRPMASSRAMRSGIGGWLANQDAIPCPRNGLAIIRWL